MKFRAWDKKNKEMFEDTFAITEDGEVVIVEQEFVTASPDYIFVDHLIIMQSTGLFDKNDKEIFEGDILVDEGSELEDNWVYVTVSYKNGMFVCEQITTDSCGYSGALDEFINHYSIFGNIYENKELLSEVE